MPRPASSTCFLIGRGLERVEAQGWPRPRYELVHAAAGRERMHGERAPVDTNRAREETPGGVRLRGADLHENLVCFSLARFAEQPVEFRVRHGEGRYPSQTRAEHS